MLKKLLISTLTTTLLLSLTGCSKETKVPDEELKGHRGCYVKPVKLVGEEYYDAINGEKINLDLYRIYITEDGTRFYFPYEINKRNHFKECSK